MSSTLLLKWPLPPFLPMDCGSNSPSSCMRYGVRTCRTEKMRAPWHFGGMKARQPCLVCGRRAGRCASMRAPRQLSTKDRVLESEGHSRVERDFNETVFVCSVMAPWPQTLRSEEAAWRLPLSEGSVEPKCPRASSLCILI